MEKYIALLRGINVGGKNKTPMKELKIAFEEGGFTNVVTYINSGNVIFTYDRDNKEEIKRKCEFTIADQFKLNISVAIISAQEFSDALQNAPTWWDTDIQSKHNAIFIIPPATVEGVLNQVGDMKPAYEQVSSYGRIIFWSAPLLTFSKTRWSKVVGTFVYDSITIRNANTTKKVIAACRINP